jgi:hypothetical protein
MREKYVGYIDRSNASFKKSLVSTGAEIEKDLSVADLHQVSSAHSL